MAMSRPRRVRKFPAVSPPPPPLGRGRRRAAQAFDAALDDAELVAARAALAQGRWQAVRTLLTTTADDWDRRGTGSPSSPWSPAPPPGPATGSWPNRSPPTPPSCSPPPPSSGPSPARTSRPGPARPASRPRCALRRPHALARTAPAGAAHGCRGDGRTALRRGSPPLPGPPPRPPSDGRPARRAAQYRRAGSAARGVRLRQLGRRTGPGRLAVGDAAGRRARRALPRPRHRRAGVARPGLLRALGSGAGPAR